MNEGEKMSFTEEKREWIKKYMLEKIRQDDGAYAQKTMENFEVSITTVKRYLKECVEQKIIVPNADKECGYCLITVEEDRFLGNHGRAFVPHDMDLPLHPSQQFITHNL